MLLAHFTLTETDEIPMHTGVVWDHQKDQPNLRLLQTQIEMAVDEALNATYTQLCGTYGMHLCDEDCGDESHPKDGRVVSLNPGVSPYNRDGGRPYTVPYVSQFQRDGGLDCATEWMEPYKGQGIHIGLVIEGKATGPRDSHEDSDPGVREGDYDDYLIEVFAQHLRVALGAVPGVELDPRYCVTDWAYYGTSSDWIPLVGAA